MMVRMEVAAVEVAAVAVERGVVARWRLVCVEALALVAAVVRVEVQRIVVVVENLHFEMQVVATADVFVVAMVVGGSPCLVVDCQMAVEMRLVQSLLLAYLV